MTSLHGHCDERFTAVRDLIQRNLDSGSELGISFTLNVRGENVVDLWGGWADSAHTRPWTEDTIVNVWSSSKTIVSLAALVLVERGLLDVNEKVVKYWPEFTAKDVEVRHLLSHTAGLSGWDATMTNEDLCNTPLATEKLASQEPWWQPGSASGYHSITMGHLVGEVVKRVTGKSFTAFIAEDLAGPLGADFQLGAKEHDWHRVAEIIPPPEVNMESLSGLLGNPPYFQKTLLNPPMDATFANTPMWRQAEVAAANGHTNSRGIGKLLSAVSNGGTVDGTRLLSPQTIERIFEVQADGVDVVMGQPLRFGIGYGLGGEGTEVQGFIPQGKVCFWGGWGGSIAIMDVERGVTITYMMNKMKGGTLGSDEARAYIKAAYEALGVA